MSQPKICSRENCPTANVKRDQTVKCFYHEKCKNEIHLICVGLGFLKTSQLTIPNLRIVCGKCVIEKDDSGNTQSEPVLNTSTQLNASTTERTTIKSIMREIKLLSNVVDSNAKKLEKIDEKTNVIGKNTETLVASSKNANNMNFGAVTSTPILSKKQMNAQMSHKPSYGAVAATMNSAKRKRLNESIEFPKLNAVKPKFNAPTPKMGTKTVHSAIKVVPKPAPKQKLNKIVKPTFSKAIWVSRVGADTTNEQFIDWIAGNTPVTDKTKFSVHKLVKKDADLSALKFVSFKVEVNENEFELLMDPDVWAANMMIREFVNKPTFGDYLPNQQQEKNISENKKNQSSPLKTLDIEMSSTEQSALTKASKTISPNKMSQTVIKID